MPLRRARFNEPLRISDQYIYPLLERKKREKEEERVRDEDSNNKVREGELYTSHTQGMSIQSIDKL